MPKRSAQNTIRVTETRTYHVDIHVRDVREARRLWREGKLVDAKWEFESTDAASFEGATDST